MGPGWTTKVGESIDAFDGHQKDARMSTSRSPSGICRDPHEKEAWRDKEREVERQTRALAGARAPRGCLGDQAANPDGPRCSSGLTAVSYSPFDLEYRKLRKSRASFFFTMRVASLTHYLPFGQRACAETLRESGPKL